MIIVVVLAWVGWGNRQRTAQIEPAQTTTSTTGVGSVTGTTLGGDPGTTVPSDVTDTTAGRPDTTGPAASVDLTVEATDGRCFLLVREGSATGRQLYAGTLEKGDSGHYTTESALWMNVGQPAAIRATLNGKVVAFPGDSGDYLVTAAGIERAAVGAVPMPAGTRVSLHTLGCPKNDADTGTLARRLSALGATIADDPADATHIVVNTCGFIRDAKEESIAAILEAVGSYPEQDVLVMGCLVERYRDELASEIPEVAGWFRLGEVDTLVELLAGAGRVGGSREEGAEVAGAPFRGTSPHAYCLRQDLRRVRPPVHVLRHPRHKGAVQGSPGRSDPGTGCWLPSTGVRGSSCWWVRTPPSGAREAGTLPAWSTCLAADARVAWVRLMYLQPEHVTDRLLEFMSAHPKLCHYLDVPFQHASTPVLRRMGRRGSAEEYLALLARARRLMPDLSTRSTFIVGFPGESRADMARLLDFVERADLRYAGAFVYSAEEGTAAADLRPLVPARTARRRMQRLTDDLFVIAAAQHQGLVGSRVE